MAQAQSPLLAEAADRLDQVRGLLDTRVIYESAG
jgi:hypothetical protein